VRHSPLRIGQQARLTLTLTNSGSEPIEIPRSRKTASFTLVQGSSAIWRSIATTARSQAIEDLAPGQSIEFHGRWSGRSNQSSAHAIKPGVYHLVSSAGDFSATTTVRLTR
jgi:hypothetical protein